MDLYRVRGHGTANIVTKSLLKRDGASRSGSEKRKRISEEKLHNAN